VEALLAEREAELGRCRQELARMERLLQDARGAADANIGASEEPRQALEAGAAAQDGTLRGAPTRAASAGDRPRNATPLAPRCS
jgi:hypothetical protein